MDERTQPSPAFDAPTAAPAARRRFAGYDLLTPREREVLEKVCTGAASKEIGRSLNISPRTVEVHRARIMHKVGARNAADLVRIYFTDNRA